MRNDSRGRIFEMVTAPDKPLRRGGDRGSFGPLGEYGRIPYALPAATGRSVLWSVWAGVPSDAGHGMSNDYNFELRRATAKGWFGQAVSLLDRC